MGDYGGRLVSCSIGPTAEGGAVDYGDRLVFCSIGPTADIYFKSPVEISQNKNPVGILG